VKSVGPRGPAAAGKGVGGVQPGADPYKFWKDFFATAKFKTPAEAEASLFQTVSDVIKAGRLDYAEAAIKAYLLNHGKDAQPWMYEMLVKCIESRKGLPGQPKEKNEADVRQTIGYAAHLAKKRQSWTDLMRVADMMVIRGYYGPVGDPGYQTNIGELVDMAADKQPANAYAPMMSINLATHDKDPKRMADAADRLLSLGWPGYDDKIRRDVREQVKLLADALRSDGKAEEADALMAHLADSEARDVFIRLTWKGEADIDMSIAEPPGATANFKNPRTVFGGAIVKNGFGNHPEEVYVCPRGFNDSYTIAVEKIVDYDEKKPVLEANLEVILHEGTAEEQRETHKIDLAKPKPIVVKLAGGRRKTVLPYVAPPEAPAAVAGAKPKDATKEVKKKAEAPANPPGASIR
jgi:hypothetical protein